MHHLAGDRQRHVLSGREQLSGLAAGLVHAGCQRAIGLDARGSRPAILRRAVRPQRRLPLGHAAVGCAAMSSRPNSWRGCGFGVELASATQPGRAEYIFQLGALSECNSPLLPGEGAGGEGGCSLAQSDQSRHRRQAHRLAAGKGLAVLRADGPSPGGRLVAEPVDERRRLCSRPSMNWLR